MNRVLQIYREYPRDFWMMIVVNFVDRLGGSLLFPFFALYITKKFQVGMTEVGGLFAIFFISGFIGSFPGGALADRFGRKGIIIFSLIATSFSTLLMGFVNEFQFFLLVAFISGIFTDVGGPAYEAVFMDLLPEEKRASGFGIRRFLSSMQLSARLSHCWFSFSFPRPNQPPRKARSRNRPPRPSPAICESYAIEDSSRLRWSAC
jgi:MFS family permease